MLELRVDRGTDEGTSVQSVVVPVSWAYGEAFRIGFRCMTLGGVGSCAVLQIR
jgi:hypothetical protein